MKNLGMQYFWENLKERYSRKTTTLDILNRVMARNIKLYALIDHIMKLFHLIKKIEVSLIILYEYANIFVHFPNIISINLLQASLKTAQINQKLASYVMHETRLYERLITNIKMIVKENPIMPVGFLFKGRCILQEAQKKLKASKMEQSMAFSLRKRLF